MATTFATPPPLPGPSSISPHDAAADAQTASASHHRPISLQSPADLLHLRATALRAAREKIDLHLPADANATTEEKDGKEDKRKAVERMVDAWIERVFRGVREGVEINGIRGVESVGWGADADGSVAGAKAGGAAAPQGGVFGEEYETYDSKLATRLTTLHGRIEELNLALANTRREAVAKSAREFREGFEVWDRELTEKEERGAASRRVARRDRGGESMDIDENEVDVEAADLGLDLDFAKKGRQEEVRRRFQGAVDTLERLERDMDAVEGRAVEAGKVVDYMEGR